MRILFMLNKRVTSLEWNQNNSELGNTCEAAGCFAKATDRIAVKVGNMEAIPLLLCSNCVTKFQDAKDGGNLRVLPNHGGVDLII